MVGWKEYIGSVKNLVPLIFRGFLLQQVEEEDTRKNRLTQVYLEQRPLNGNSRRVDVLICCRWCKMGTCCYRLLTGGDVGGLGISIAAKRRSCGKIGVQKRLIKCVVAYLLTVHCVQLTSVREWRPISPQSLTSVV